MGFCDILKINQKGLLDAVAKDVANKRIAGEPYVVEDTMLMIYNKLVEGGSEKDRAITAAALVPGAVLVSMSIHPPNAIYLAPVAGKIAELQGKTTDFDAIISIMGLNEDFATKLNENIAAENADEDVESQPESKELPQVRLISGTPVVNSGLSTTVLEINTPYAQSVEEDPAVKANGEFIRKFIRLGQVISRNLSEGYVLDNISNYRLALVSSNRIPQESRVNADVYGPVVYAFINEQGQIVTDENGHTPHAFLRKVEKTDDGYIFPNTKGNSRLQVNSENALNSRMSEEQFAKKIKNEAAFLNNAARKISANPEMIIPLEAVKGTLGVISGAVSTNIDSIPDFQKEFLLPEGVGSGTGRIANVTKNNKTYQAFVFNHPGYDYVLQAQPKKLSQSKYADVVKEILLSEDYTVAQKKNLLFNILQKQNIDFGATEIKLALFKPVNGKITAVGFYTLDLSRPEFAKELVEQFLNNSYLNVPIASNQQQTFDGPILVGDKYQVGEIQLASYVYNNFRVHAPLDSKGNLISPHPVITYKAPIEESVSQVPQQEISVEQIEKELETLKSEQAEGSMSIEELLSQIPDDKPSDMDEVFGRKKTGLDKVDTLSSEATAKQIAEAKTWFENSPLSKAIPLEKWFEIVNSGKVAEFTANAIKLYAGSNYTDLYHEGWHGFSQLFLTKEEKVALYKEVRKLHGNITFLQAEELLAEDFRKYRLSNGTLVMDKSPAKRSIFKKILDFLRALFGNTETKVQYREMVAQEKALEIIKQSYDVLYKGEFEDRKPNIDNSFFLTLNKGVEGKNGQVLSAKDSKDISDAMDSIVSGIIRDYSSSPKEVLNKEGALEALYNEVFNQLKASFIELKEQGKLQEAVAIGTALTNFGSTSKLKSNAENTMLGYHFKTSRYLESLAKSEDITDLLDLDIVDSVEDYMEYYDKGGNEVSVKDLADNSVLYAVRSMRERNKAGEVIKDRFGFDKLSNFATSWNRLGTILKESYSIEDMLSKINVEASRNKAFEDLQAVLGGTVEAKDDYKFKMQTSFWQAFNKAFVPIHVTYIRTTVNKDTGLEDIGVRVKRAEGEVSSVEKDLVRKFQANKDLANTSELNGTRVLNVTKVLENYKGINYQNVVQFYKDMGVLPDELDPSVINYLLSGNVLVNTNTLVVNLNKLAKTKESNLTTANPIDFLSTDQPGFRGMRSTIKAIVEEYGASVGSTGSTRKLTAEGTTQFETSLNSRATRVTQLLNEAKSLDDLLANPATANFHPDNNPAMATNPIMKSLFIMDKGAIGYKSRKQGTKLYLFNVSGVTVERQDIVFNEKLGADVPLGPPSIYGTKNISLDEYTKLNQDIHTLFLGGYVENVRASDKSTSLAWKVSGENANITPADVINKTYLYKATQAVVDILAGEIATMSKYYNAELNVFDSKGNPIKLNEWQFFSDDVLIDSDTRRRLNGFIGEAEYNAAELSQMIMKEMPEVREGIEEGIRRKIRIELEKLNAIIDNNIDLTGNDIVLGKDLRRSIEQRAKLPSRPALKTAVLTAFITESMIRNHAMFSITNGTLASYRSADDVIKRNTITSTGNSFRSDQAAQAYISAQGRLLEAAYSRRTGKPVMPRDYTGVLRTAILKEMTIDGQKLNKEWYELAENSFKAEGYSQEEINNILEAYRSMDEADAQAYITMDTYRQLSIASDEWTSEQEYMYNKLVAGENINNPQQYFPVRKYQYTGPLLNAGAPVQALHKYSLFPLIPTVISGTNLEKLNNAMMEAGIDYATYETGNKAARVGQPVEAFVINEENGVRTVPENVASDLKNNVNLIHVEYLRDQLRINNQYKKSATFSTQFRKLLGDGIYENGKAKNKKLAKAHEAFLKNIDDLIAYETEQLEKEINTKKKLVSLIKKELQRRDLEDYKIEAIDIDRNGNLKYNLDALPAAAEMEKILNAVVNRRLIRAKLTGEALVQVSSAGFEKVETSNDLKFYRPGQAAQVKIPLQGEYRKLLYMKHPDGKAINSLERLNALLKDPKWMKENKALVSMTGVRIPVQGLNSMEFFEVAEFLPPAGGNIIVVPTEMVAKSGSDFDIDKLTMYFPTIFAGKRKNAKSKKVDALTDQMLDAIFGETIEEGEYVVELDEQGVNKYKNNIINLSREILLHPDNFTKLIRPIATDLVKETSEAYAELESTEDALSKSSVFDYSYNLKKQQENSIGKRALGISAKGNTYNTMFQKVSKEMSDTFAYHSAFTSLYGSPFVSLKMAENVTNDSGEPITINYTVFNKKSIQLPFGKIGDLKDSQGKHLKSDIISQIMNGHVDVASDSWIFNIGADDVTTSYLLNLIDMGVNYDYAVRFLNNSFVREYLNLFRALKKSDLNKAILPNMMEDYTVINMMLRKHARSEYDIILGKKDKQTGEYLYDDQGNVVTRPPGTKDLFQIVSILEAKSTLTEDQLKSNTDLSALMEFMKFVYYVKPMKSIRLTTDVDTKKSATFVEAAAESENVFNLTTNPVTSDFVDQLLSNNVLGTFANVKDFQMTAFNELFGFRADRTFIKSLNRSIASTDLAYDKEGREKYIAAVTNGFTSYLVNRISFPFTSENFTTVKSYKGLPVNFVKFDNNLAGQVAISKDGVINIDIQNLNAKSAALMNKFDLTYPQLLSVVLESQYIRATAEESVTDHIERAIANLYIDKHLIDFTNPNGVAQKYQEMMDNKKAVAALEGYSIVEDLIIYDYNGGKMIGIKTDRANVEDMERYHAEIKMLQESANPMVREFFTRLPQVVTSVEGFKNGRFSLINVVPFDQVSQKANEAIKDYKSLPEEIKETIIGDYFSKTNGPIQMIEVSEEFADRTVELKTDEEVEEFIKKCKV